jgi:hypothetical protein
MERKHYQKHGRTSSQAALGSYPSALKDKTEQLAD